MRYENLQGKKFNEYTVLERHSTLDAWICQCSCGIIKPVKAQNLKNGSAPYCHSCASKKKWQKRKPVRTKILGRLFNQIKRNATLRNIEFNLTSEFLHELFVSSNGVCPISGLAISIAEDNIKHQYGYTTASLDRKDSTKGYTKDNVWWIHKDINKMKMDFTLDKFKELCKLVVETTINGADNERS